MALHAEQSRVVLEQVEWELGEAEGAGIHLLLFSSFFTPEKNI